jgi:hypothetical protein
MGPQKGSRTVVCDLGGLGGADAWTVDTLARLQLASRRLGLEFRLRHASSDLLGLLDLCGLNEVLRVEAERQPEQREERRCIEEERELDDPPA